LCFNAFRDSDTVLVITRTLHTSQASESASRLSSKPVKRPPPGVRQRLHMRATPCCLYMRETPSLFWHSLWRQTRCSPDARFSILRVWNGEACVPSSHVCHPRMPRGLCGILPWQQETTQANEAGKVLCLKVLTNLPREAQRLLTQLDPWTQLDPVFVPSWRVQVRRQRWRAAIAAHSSEWEGM
jgi:hypothetical protein